jgi:hypothetical protein
LGGSNLHALKLSGFGVGEFQEPIGEIAEAEVADQDDDQAQDDRRKTTVKEAAALLGRALLCVHGTHCAKEQASKQASIIGSL